jgi:hypothetical protein
VSVLLRQPHGFEGVLAHRESFAPCSLAVAHGPKMRDSYFDRRAAAPGSKTPQRKYHDSIIALEELFGFKEHFLERLSLIFKELPDFLRPAVRPGEGHLIRCLPFEVRMHSAKGAIPVTAVGGFVRSAKRLNICLRHRPRSIPQAQESA